MLFYDWQRTLAGNDLRKVEMMSTLAGIRTSYPILYPEVVALATRVPPRMMLPGTRLRDFKKELRWNEANHALRSGLVA